MATTAEALVRPAAALLRLLCRRRAVAFRQALQNPRQAQRRLLAGLIRDAAATAYGRSLRLDPAGDVTAFQSKVPIVDYEILAPWIERQKAGEAAVLTRQPIRRFEQTSGSTGAVKTIPYTAALLGSFDSLFRIWACDLLDHRLRPRTGRLFASVSPGLADDAAYLSGGLRRLLRPFLAAPPELGHLTDPADFRDALAVTLAAEAGLEVISVWSPTFLLVLFDHLAVHRERLLPALRAGRLQRAGRSFDFRSLSRDRAALLETDPIPWGRLWPGLQLVSCWTAAAARRPAARLQALLPGVPMQGKGLIATEAPVTVPLIGAPGDAPLLDEVFLELESEDGEVHLLHELVSGASYRLILSQKGGLLRYRLGDRVQVTGYVSQTPCLVFLGREKNVCDLAGEKLNEDFVAATLDACLPAAGLRLLVPVADTRAGYVLLTDDAAAVAERIDARLQHAFRYRQARRLGQLGPLQVVITADMATRVHDFFMAEGLRWGDVKDRALLTDADQGVRLLSAVADRHTRPAYRA